MALDIMVSQLSVYILVFCRVGGMIFFNPLLSRRSIPAQFKVGMVLGLTLIIVPYFDYTLIPQFTDLKFVLMMMSELFIGVCMGFIFITFYFMIFAAGDMIDMGIGLAMAKAFNPDLSIQSSVSGNIFQLFFVIYFFVTNSHLVLIRIIVASFDLVNLGTVTLSSSISQFMLTLFVNVFILSIQLALPYITAAFVVEMSMGILMKMVPQINVFAINFPFKILFGMVWIFLFAQATSDFLLTYMNNMLMSMQNFFVQL